MRTKVSIFLLSVHLFAASAVAGSAVVQDADVSKSPGALSGWWAADGQSVVTNIESRLPSQMSVAVHDHFIVAAAGSMEQTLQHARSLAAYDAEIRRRYFPNLARRRMLVIISDESSELERLTSDLYPDISFPEGFASGYYHRDDRLILASVEAGDGVLLRELTRAHVQDDNPNVPRWFEDAMVTLYESSEWRTGRLTPMLDARMAQISPDEDLTYDIFAGICDCSEVTAEQIALIRLLLIHLHEHGQLTSLYNAIRRQGRYVTLLQALDAMNFDREAWKAYAERSVQALPNSRLRSKP